MTEGTTQSEKDYDQKATSMMSTLPENKAQAPDIPLANHVPMTKSLIVWTPRFIVIFGLLLVIGLSTASLLTEGWINGFIVGSWALLSYTALLFGGWIAVIACTHSLWIRISGIFGVIWAILTSINYVLGLLVVDPHLSIIIHLNAGIHSALLGAYICLSINRTPLRRWDSLFFRLAPIIGSGIVILIFLLPPADRSGLHLESIAATVIFYLCILIWWIRPSCWKTQSGPAFLFGLAPAIQLLLSIPNSASPETNFFFTQVILLCFLLGIARILQGETRLKTLGPLANDTLHRQNNQQHSDPVVQEVEEDSGPDRTGVPT